MPHPSQHFRERVHRRLHGRVEASAQWGWDLTTAWGVERLDDGEGDLVSAGVPGTSEMAALLISPRMMMSMLTRRILACESGGAPPGVGCSAG